MLNTSAIFLAAAVIAVPIFTRLGLGSVLGYLAAGVVIGPSGFGFVGEVEQTLHFAELGVVLLLFLVGLELEPARLWRMRASVFGTGGAQVAVTAGIVAAAAAALGLGWRGALVAGVGLAMSSTAFALQVLGEKNEMGSPHGRSAFGILLFQDLAAIPVLALVPLLGTTGASGGSGFTRVPVVLGVILALVVAGRLLLRPIFKFVMAARSHELSVASALLVVLGTAVVMHSVGLSMALGAFLAGVLLADSEYRHELEANIEPFKGLLLGLFFMAVGMSANLRVLLDRPAVVVGLALALVGVKLGVLFALGKVTRLPGKSALSLGVALSQGGEFGFVIFGAGREAGVVGAELVELLVMVVTLSMGVTPLLFLLRDRAFSRAAPGEAREFDAIQENGSRVIIAGFGRFGQIVSRLLRVKRIGFTALDVSPTHVDFLRKFGSKIHYGDASRVDLLRAAGAERAEVFVLAIDDVEASVRTAKVVRHHFPHLRIIARARNRQHAYALLALEIPTVIRETFAASLDAGRVVLEELGLPTTDAKEAARRFAEHDEAYVRSVYKLRDDEKALIASSKQYGEELEKAFEQDAR
ncbi:monovalent cation:proton antiporter-2 (CPA2) family protein [Chondromyces apiculatus]|uniref:Glutathione-regulated potassium-efflux system protein KefB n=1 Tax=Chondromyces apiculatus DSM 436 TaxID=1192034 RepID=A0A017SWC2_9BACT|nr:monovalent cation:proton antiporter-2 (CPA2) family protein [Chondromyces apiculatus]EYF01274.1 Glutathione-regulated potassium-efflux system protein KefB [Chondromyces apiculatus DSM 436]